MSKDLELKLSADDTNIFYSHNDASNLMQVVNLELKNISSCFYTNKLSTNVKKSNFVIFRQNRQTVDLAFNIRIIPLMMLRKLLFLV